MPKFDSATGRYFSFGYRPSPLELLATRRWLKDYRIGDTARLVAPLPLPPSGLNLERAASASLSQMEGNDNQGDCVAAWFAHQDGIWTGNANGKANCLVWTTAQTLALYHQVGGPGDNGLDPIVFLNYMKNTGVTLAGASRKIAGWVAIDPENRWEVQEACWLFGGLGLCMNLPDAYTNPFPAGNDFYWWRQGPPDPNQGHMFGAAGYVAGSKWMRCDTWGMTGFISLPAISYYCADAQGGAIYAALSQDWLAAATKLAPNGYNWTQLEADLAAI